MRNFKIIEDIKNLYKRSFQEHGDSHHAVQWPKGRQRERFTALTQSIRQNGNFSILDFGCGLSHLKEFLDANFQNVDYTGVDLVEDFLEHSKKKFSNGRFLLPEEFERDDRQYDYVISSGTFNISYGTSPAEHQEEVLKILHGLFAKTKIYLAADFMTDRVDFHQATSYHANPEEITGHLINQFSRRVIVNHSYLPYEFCVTVFKNDAIKRPDNVYED